MFLYLSLPISTPPPLPPQDHRGMVMVWVWVSAIMIAINIVLVIIGIILTLNIIFAIIAFIVFGVAVYCILVVRSYALTVSGSFRRDHKWLLLLLLSFYAEINLRFIDRKSGYLSSILIRIVCRKIIISVKSFSWEALAAWHKNLQGGRIQEILIESLCFLSFFFSKNMT